MNNIFSHIIKAGIVAATLFAAIPLYALDRSHYADNSVLSQGTWRRIKVKATGMQIITNSDLKAMGFSDPSRVNVYGTGGRMVREALTADMPDDLPILPSIRTPRGIVFFGTDNVTWEPAKDGWFTHTLNPYCEESYYFVSDRETTVAEIPKARTAAGGDGEILNTFPQRLLHEQDIQAPSQEGRMLLGEDFRTERSRKFTFDTPGQTGGGIIRVNFGAKVTSGSSSLLISADGNRLPSTTADNIGACSSDFIKTTTTTKEFTSTADKLTVGVDYSYSGALFTARLDYIEVFYERELVIKDGELHFYDTFNGNTVEIKGCTSDTRIWDVTDYCAPAEVSYTLDGETARFSPENGYHEYVAFNPNSITRGITRNASMANQDIHGMESPDMVIVAPAEYATAANRIARLHEEADGFKVTVLTPNAIYNEFSGGHPDVGAFRKLLKMWHDRDGERSIKYCLLLGRGSYDTKMVSTGVRNAGYKPLPLWQSPTGTTESTAFSTDDIIGMLDDTDEDSFNMSRAKMQVAVGRLPVTSAREAGEVAAKLEKYIRTPNYGTWRNRVLLIADDQDGGLHLTQTEEVYNRLKRNAPHFQYEKLYLDSYPLVSSSVGMTYPQAKERMMRLFNEGVVYTNYVGHASANSWTHEKLLTWEDIISFSNPNLTFFYGATCSFGTWDADNVSGAEKLVLNPDAGFIGAITPSRTVYMTQNGTLNNYMADWILTTEDENGSVRIGDTFIRAKNSYNDDNKLRYCLISDPAIRVPKPTRNVVIESINGTDLATAADLPELKAMGKADLKGSITNADGSLADDFNGTVTLELYDAERAVETNGNGKDGEVMHYNDRKTRLTFVSAKVNSGLWEATLRLPAETDGNYSPARITGYAWSDTGKEAHGSTESVYVYGHEESVSDTEGPEITAFYMNYPGMEEGSMVNSNPVAHASFTDESGINISDAGIGHRMTLTLDGKHVYDDVNSYFAIDPDNPLAGSIAYPLADLSAGEHTLKLIVSDNANNTSSKEISFVVGEVRDPLIRDLGTDVNPASTSVVFTIDVDHPNTKMEYNIEVFDLLGKRVWNSAETQKSDMQGGMQTRWNLRDSAGRRVARGIYLYRATVKTPDGMYSSKTKKLAVTAQ